MSRRLRPLLPAVPAPPAPLVEPPQEKTTRDSIRACDACRRRKIRCDGSFQAERTCTYCVKRDKACTYAASAAPRRPDPPMGYIKSLEERVAKIESVLREHHPDIDLARELSTLALEEQKLPPGPAEIDDSDVVSSDEDEESNLFSGLSRGFPVRGFFGRSSMVNLVRTMADTKDTVTGSNDTWSRFSKRPEFWRMPKHEERECIAYSYPATWYIRSHVPPSHVLKQLVDLYFDKINIFYPLLHRPLFDRQLAVDLDNNQFTAVVLLVCACGSRFRKDLEPRTSVSEKPPGWDYFEVIQPYLRLSTPEAPSLYHIQIYTLAFIYLTSTVVPFTAAWTLLGMATRVAYHVGANRAKIYQVRKTNLLGELWKRAFWILVILDRQLCLSGGNASAISDESFDLDPPLDVSDDMWDLDNEEDRYPLRESPSPSRGSTISGFTAHVELHVITGKAMQTLYAINRARVQKRYFGWKWERETRIELELSLRNWMQRLPEHLKWNPAVQDDFALSQSAVLHTAFHHARVIVHNPFPFIQSAEQEGPPLEATAYGCSLAMSMSACTRAAHACSRVFAEQLDRGVGVFSAQITAAFASALVMMVNLYGTLAKMSQEQKEKGSKTHAMMLADVAACMDAIKLVEKAWDPAARIWDILRDLAPVPDCVLWQDELRDQLRKHEVLASFGHGAVAVWPPLPAEIAQPISSQAQVVPAGIPTTSTFSSSVAAEADPAVDTCAQFDMDVSATASIFGDNLDDLPDNLKLIFFQSMLTMPSGGFIGAVSKVPDSGQTLDPFNISDSSSEETSPRVPGAWFQPQPHAPSVSDPEQRAGQAWSQDFLAAFSSAC